MSRSMSDLYEWIDLRARESEHMACFEGEFIVRADAVVDGMKYRTGRSHDRHHASIKSPDKRRTRPDVIDGVYFLHPARRSS